ncbi:predicted protein [Histoplasma capsulatum var. duboisii H88]|uniref:Predicted protein n=1 Tax=Ajellomyces capsulatus (strain H88) TaxID=544711 RepID=F0UFI5_AJEC8|nr:predicted protein [Histoplasma capsulatum var. duboisii H88]
MEAGVILERQSTADWGARPGPLEDGIYHAKSTSLSSRPPATVAPGQLAIRGRSVRDPHVSFSLAKPGLKPGRIKHVHQLSGSDDPHYTVKSLPWMSTDQQNIPEWSLNSLKLEITSIFLQEKDTSIYLFIIRTQNSSLATSTSTWAKQESSNKSPASALEANLHANSPKIDPG